MPQITSQAAVCTEWGSFAEFFLHIDTSVNYEINSLKKSQYAQKVPSLWIFGVCTSGHWRDAWACSKPEKIWQEWWHENKLFCFMWTVHSHMNISFDFFKNKMSLHNCSFPFSIIVISFHLHPIYCIWFFSRDPLFFSSLRFVSITVGSS